MLFSLAQEKFCFPGSSGNFTQEIPPPPHSRDHSLHLWASLLHAHDGAFGLLLQMRSLLPGAGKWFVD